MMKFNVFNIVIDHASSFWDGKAVINSIFEIVILYFFPVILGILTILFLDPLDKGVFSLSVSVFAIFSALLLSVQIGLFSLFQTKWTPPDDKRKLADFYEKLEIRRKLFSEINVNISYLNVVSCTTIVVVFVFYTFCVNIYIESFVFISIFSHFVLNLFIVIKRTHALFQVEYDI